MNNELLLVICFGIILTVLLIGFIVTVLLLYRRKSGIQKRAYIEFEHKFSKSLLESKIEIQEQTMSQISNDIHDEMGSTISLIRIKLDIIEPEDIESTRKHITELQNIALQVANKLRNIAHSLNSSITKYGFAQAIATTLDQLKEAKNLKVIYEIIGNEYPIRNEQEIIIYRMCQEIINNVIKHAEADVLSFKIKYMQDQLKIEIKDNGKGFNVLEQTKKANQQAGLGLSSIMNRSKLINADLQINSEEGKGSLFVITVPIVEIQSFK